MPEASLRQIKDTLAEMGDESLAMRKRRQFGYTFDFYGVYAKDWLVLVRRMLHRDQALWRRHIVDFIDEFFDDEYRESHYCGLEILQHFLPEKGEAGIRALDRVLRVKPHWDTVDWIAKITGEAFIESHELGDELIRKWTKSGEVWLIRAGILSQRHYSSEECTRRFLDDAATLIWTKEIRLRAPLIRTLRRFDAEHPDLVRQYFSNMRIPQYIDNRLEKWAKQR